MKDLLFYVLGLINWLARKTYELSEIIDLTGDEIRNFIDWIYPVQDEP